MERTIQLELEPAAPIRRNPRAPRRTRRQSLSRPAKLLRLATSSLFADKDGVAADVDAATADTQRPGRRLVHASSVPEPSQPTAAAGIGRAAPDDLQEYSPGRRRHCLFARSSGWIPLANLVVAIDVSNIGRCSQVSERLYYLTAFQKMYQVSEVSVNNPSPTSVGCGTMMMVKRHHRQDDVKIYNHVLSAEGSAGQILSSRRSNGRHLLVANVHFSWRRYGSIGKEQAAYVRRHLESMGSHGARTVWCGDFNTTPDRLPALVPDDADLRDAFQIRNCPTWFASRDDKSFRLDYVLYASGLKVIQARCPDELPARNVLAWALDTFGSDHAPLCVDFEFVE